MYTSSPARKQIARKPSHFGSNCHPSPVGTSGTTFASIGASGGWNGRSIPGMLPWTLGGVGPVRAAKVSTARRTSMLVWRERTPGHRKERELEEQVGRTVWSGRFGDVPLRVDMLPSGRIAASWAIRGNERRAVVDTINQLEQRVLFQLMLGAGPDQDGVAKEIIAA